MADGDDNDKLAYVHVSLHCVIVGERIACVNLYVCMYFGLVKYTLAVFNIIL